MSVTGNKFLEFTSGTLWCEETEGDAPVAGEGTRFIWVPSKKAFRAGFLSQAQTIGTFEPNLFTAWDQDKLGEGSVAFGLNTEASGRFSMAVGENVVAEGQGTISAGRATRNKGQYSFLLGNDSSLGSTVNTFFGSYSFGLTIGSNSSAHSSFQLGTLLSLGQRANHSFQLGNNIAVGDDSHSVFAVGTNMGIAGPTIDIPPVPPPLPLGSLAIHSVVFGSSINLSSTSHYTTVLPSDSSQTLGTSPYSLLRGCENIINDSAFATVEGSGNNITNSFGARQYGNGLSSTGSSFSSNSGSGNILVNALNSVAYGNGLGITDSNAAYLMGFTSLITNSPSGFAHGSSNNIIDSQGATGFGLLSIVNNSPYSFVTGNGNSLNGSRWTLSNGLNNAATNADASVLLGSGNRLTDAQISLAFGANNIISNELYDQVAAPGFLGWNVAMGQFVSILADEGTAPVPHSAHSCFAFGTNSKILGSISAVSFGTNNTTEVGSHYSFTAGLRNQVLGYGGIALGSDNVVSGFHSVAMGFQAEAAGTMGMGAFAALDGAKAYGPSSIALGKGTIAGTSGQNFSSVALGQHVTASGDSTFAFGHNINTDTDNSLILGNFINTNTDTIPDFSFAVGLRNDYVIFANHDDTTAKVGINNLNPITDLHVGGNFRSDGYLELDNLGPNGGGGSTTANEARLYYNGSDIMFVDNSGEVPIGPSPGSSHPVNQDQFLDFGGPNEVSALTIDTHITSTDNPHVVTKAQVGLGNLTNDLQIPDGDRGVNIAELDGNQRLVKGQNALMVKAITIENPGPNENIPIMIVPELSTVKQVFFQVDTGTVEFGVFNGADINATGSAVFAGGSDYEQATSSKQSTTSFTANEDFPVGNTMILKTNANVSGSPTKLHVSIAYEV